MAIEASAPEGGPPGRPATIYTVAPMSQATCPASAMICR